jgi:curved DNA-binding protein CbpA
MDPWRILGITQEYSPQEITRKYRQLMLIYHPDKKGPNGISEETREKRFHEIQQAYNFLQKIPKFRDAPDYKMEYSIDSTVTIPQYQPGPLGPGPSGPSGSSFNLDRFNEDFMASKIQMEKDGFIDPDTIGRAPSNYDSFNKEKRPDTIDVAKDPINARARTTTNTELMQYNPMTGYGMKGKELGITKLDDYSVTFGRKNNKFNGADLLNTYNDFELETLALERDSKLRDQFGDSNPLGSKLEQRLNDYHRESISVKVFDKSTTNNYLKFQNTPEPTKDDLARRLYMDNYSDYLERRQIRN